MKRMGVVLSPQGAPLSNRAVTVRDWATGAVVTTLTTNAQGRWEIDLPDETKQYWVDVWFGGTSTLMTVQTPASIELEHLFVRYGAKLPAGTLIGGVTIDPGAPPGTGALDPRYVQKAGDTMSGGLTLDQAQATIALRESDAPVDNRVIAISQPSGDGRLRIAARNDAGAAGGAVIDITRTGNNITGLSVPAPITAAALGHRLGVLGPTAFNLAMPDTDASIFLYRNSNVNWAGFGADGSGNLWIRTGLSGTPVPSLAIDNAGAVYIQRGPLFQAGGYGYLGNFNSAGTTYPRGGNDLAVGWNFAAGAREVSLWNTDTAASTSFMFRQLLTAASQRTLLTVTSAGAVTAGDGTARIQGEIMATKAAAPTLGRIYLGNTTAKSIEWDGTRFYVNYMPVTVLPPDAASASMGLTLYGTATSDVSMAIENTNVSQRWFFGVQGAAATLAPSGAFFIGQYGSGGWLSMRVFDGRVALGPNAFVAAGATAQLDVQAINSSVPALVARGNGHATTSDLFQVVGVGTFAIRHDAGIRTSNTAATTAVSGLVQAFPVFNASNVLLGWVPIYTNRS